MHVESKNQIKCLLWFKIDELPAMQHKFTDGLHRIGR